MSLPQILNDDLPGMYEALGDRATLTVSGADRPVFVMRGDNFDISDYEYDRFKVVMSDAEGLSEGDTLSVGGKAGSIRNFDPTHDGMEMILAVKFD